MLLNTAVILFAVIVLVVLVHYGAFFIFLRALRQEEWTKPASDYTPKTMVLLALRGADPFLGHCIEGLLKQDYPNYDIRLIVDHPEDAALPIAEKIVKEHGAKNVESIVVEKHLETCSLKCNSLLHAVETLDPSYEIIVVLDADTNPHTAWLRQLVEPLSDPRFAAATGHRWYIPEKSNPGSLIRYLWNAAAVVQLYLYRIAWGGSMALRRDLFKKGNLLEQWKTSFSDDVTVSESVKRVGGKTAFVPSLLMINRETCTLGSFYRWVKRQLLCAKLHHPAWNIIATQGLMITLPLLAALILMLAGAVRADSPVVLWSLASLLIYWLGVFGTLPILERTIRRKLRQRGECLEPWKPVLAMRTLVMIPVTQFVYTYALMRLYFLHRVEWRGVEYEIGLDRSIHLVEYRPYRQNDENSDEGVSL